MFASMTSVGDNRNHPSRSRRDIAKSASTSSSDSPYSIMPARTESVSCYGTRSSLRIISPKLVCIDIRPYESNQIPVSRRDLKNRRLQRAVFTVLVSVPEWRCRKVRRRGRFDRAVGCENRTPLPPVESGVFSRSRSGSLATSVDVTDASSPETTLPRGMPRTENASPNAVLIRSFGSPRTLLMCIVPRGNPFNIPFANE